MVVFHCTKKIQYRLKITPSADVPKSDGRLGCWYCNEFTALRRKYLIFVNELTLLPIIVPAKGLTTPDKMLAAFKQQLVEGFEFIGVPEQVYMQELSEMENVVFAKTASKSTLASMNEFVRLAEPAVGINDHIEPDSIRKFSSLAGCPMGGASTGSLRYRVPVKELCKVLLEKGEI